MIIVSDLHIDNGHGAFTPNADAFNFFLDCVGSDDLLIAGDFLDLWRYSLQSIMDGPHKAIIHRLRQKPNVTLIRGNHDVYMEAITDVFQCEVFDVLDVCGWRIFHGHSFDFRLDTPQERWLAATAARLIEGSHLGFLHRLAGWLNSSKRENGYLKKAIIDAGQAHLTICGHTHVATHDGWYVNSGTWTGDTCSYVVLEHDGKPRLEVWRNA